MIDNRDWLRRQMPRKDNGSPDPVSKAVLVALANYADVRGYCFPSQQKLVQFTGYGESAVARALKLLEAQGYIQRNPRRSSGTWTGGRFAGTAYWLQFEKADDNLERNVEQPPALAEHQRAASAERAERSRRSASVPFIDPVTFEMNDEMQAYYETYIRGSGAEVEILESLAQSRLPDS